MNGLPIVNIVHGEKMYLCVDLKKPQTEQEGVVWPT